MSACLQVGTDGLTQEENNSAAGAFAAGLTEEVEEMEKRCHELEDELEQVARTLKEEREVCMGLLATVIP